MLLNFTENKIQRYGNTGFFSQGNLIFQNIRVKNIQPLLSPRTLHLILKSSKSKRMLWVIFWFIILDYTSENISSICCENMIMYLHYIACIKVKKKVKQPNFYVNNLWQ